MFLPKCKAIPYCPDKIFRNSSASTTRITGLTIFVPLCITIPETIPTIKVVVMLGVMGMLRNFDQIFVMSNANILDRVRNLLYLIYTDGIVQFRIGPASAAACLVLVATYVISTIVRKTIRYDEEA